MGNLECSFLEGSVCTLQATTKTDAIIELIKKTSVFQEINDIVQLSREVLEREKRQNTGFGHGVAVAHAQYDGIDSVMMALGISEKGIEYHSMDNLPVHLLFIIASPSSLQDEYLRALSALVKIIRDSSFREKLLRASSITQIEELLHKGFCALLRKEEVRY